MSDIETKFHEMATVVRKYLQHCLADDKFYCFLRIHIPNTVKWTEYVSSALTSKYGESRSSRIQYSPSEMIFKSHAGYLYKREISMYDFHSDLGCVSMLTTRSKLQDIEIPADVCGGTSNSWVVPDVDGVVIVHVPDSVSSSSSSSSTSLEGGRKRLHGWRTKMDTVDDMTDHTVKMYMTFRTVHGNIPTADTLTGAFLDVWMHIYGTNNPYTMQECSEMFAYLPSRKRITRHMTHTDTAGHNEYMEGFVARPALTKYLKKMYVIQTSAGLWLYDINSRAVNMLERGRDTSSASNDIQTTMRRRMRMRMRMRKKKKEKKEKKLELDLNEKQLQDQQDHRYQKQQIEYTLSADRDMMCLPVLLYAMNSWGYLDPLVPYKCSEVDRLTSRFESQRIAYDISTLERFASRVEPYVAHIAKSLAVGSLWIFGAPGGSKHIFANSDTQLGEYRDLVPYRSYVGGSSVLTSRMSLTGLSIVSPRDSEVKYMTSSNLDKVNLEIVREGILCNRTDTRGVFQFASRCIHNISRDIVAYAGTDVFPFNRLVPVKKLQRGIVYEATAEIDSRLSKVSLGNLRAVRRVDECTAVSLTLNRAVVKWQKLTHPVWPLFSVYSSLSRMNSVIWAAVSKCMNLSEGEQTVLLVHNCIGMFMHTIESVPLSWRFVTVDVSLESLESLDSARVETVSLVDVQSLSDRKFDYVIMFQCHLSVQNDDNDLSHLLQTVAPNVKAFVQFGFDRGMIVEMPLAFRYIFGTTKLITDRTTSADTMFWRYHSEFCDFCDVPMDLDEASVFMQNVDFTLHPKVAPSHLSNFVPKIPQVRLCHYPEKLQVCVCYCRYSTFSPLMDRIHTKRELSVRNVLESKRLEVAQVGNSDYFLANGVTCRESIIHALLQAAIPVYYKEIADPTRLVLMYEKWVNEILCSSPECVLQVCKGVHVIAPLAYEVCIFNIMDGGSVSSTLLPKTKLSTASERGLTHSRNLLEKCIYILRVSDKIAYTVARRRADGSYGMIHPTVDLATIGQCLSGMVKEMTDVEVSTDEMS